jgi:endonuclease YncB( thermonuclease family)
MRDGSDQNANAARNRRSSARRSRRRLKAQVRLGFGHGVAAVLVAVGIGVVVPASILPHRAAQASRGFSCTVTGVHDGDGPIYCAEGPKIRLQAVAARELDGSCNPGQPCPTASADDARLALDRLTRGQVLRCEATGMSYSRIVAWCWLPDGRSVNCAMVKSGTALAWRKFDPDGRLCSGR